MEVKEIFDTKITCLNYLARKNIAECMNSLRPLIYEANDPYYQLQLEKVESIYLNILKYSVKGVEDPQRQKIYTDTLQKIVALVVQITDYLLTEKAQNFTYRRKWNAKHRPSPVQENPERLVTELSQAAAQLAETNDEVTPEKESLAQAQRDAGNQLFMQLWLNDTYDTAHKQLFQQVMHDKQIPWQVQSQMVSAVSLALLRAFDPAKFHLLLDIWEKRQPQLSERAFLGIMLGLNQYDALIGFYPDLVSRIQALAADNDTLNHLEAVMIQMVKAKQTEEITRQWQDEILPEMHKIQPKVEERLSLDDILSDDPAEDKNPDWETVFEDSPDLLEKLQQFSQMQLEGSDVLMSAFAQLKQFDFFKELSNWFLPFDTNNYYLLSSVRDERLNVMPFIRNLAESFHMCNSDKYSFALNIRFIPDSQKEMMTNVFDEEVRQMKELESSDEKIDPLAKSKTIYAQYFQDLYRFFKLYHGKAEFDDIFEQPFELYNKQFYQWLTNDIRLERNVAEFYFSQGKYKEASQVFVGLLDKTEANQELFEKIAYSYQKQMQYEKALEYYHKADFFDTNKKWLNKRMAFCYRKKQDYSKALEYYLKAEKAQPENLHIQANLGHVYLELGQYDQALQHYFKVEYKKPDNLKVIRPIAWCAFLQNKLETAQKYLHRIIEKGQANAYDYMNMGHIQWAMGQQQQALVHYQKSLAFDSMDYQEFRNYFLDDLPQLKEKNIPETDAYLVLDWLRYHQAGMLNDKQ